MSGISVPYFRPPITDEDVEAVAAAVRSGWLTSGPQVKRFEQEFAAAVGAKHALAVNSCTAALHLAVEALHLQADEVVLIPTMTFAATAEVIRYQGAWPLLVDCDPVTAHLDFEDAERLFPAANVNKRNSCERHSDRGSARSDPGTHLGSGMGRFRPPSWGRSNSRYR